MITVRVWGGLGNQLFQYAIGYALAKKYNMPLQIDNSYYYNQHYKLAQREYKLDKFNTIHKNIVSNKKIPGSIRLIKNKYVNKLVRIPERFELNLGNNCKYIKETRKKHIGNLITNDYSDIYLDGYWQTEKYFQDYKNDIKKQFLMSQNHDIYMENILKEVRTSNSVSVHIRRTDYLELNKKNKGPYMPSIEYYKNSFKKIKEFVDQPTFYFFSDDMSWVKENFGEDINYRFISLNTEDSDIDEMMCMANCKHNIIAASTFSWWGAWLNQNPEKVVIAPQKNFNNADIIPDGWIKVSE